MNMNMNMNIKRFSLLKSSPISHIWAEHWATQFPVIVFRSGSQPFNVLLSKQFFGSNASFAMYLEHTLK